MRRRPFRPLIVPDDPIERLILFILLWLGFVVIMDRRW